MPSSASRIVDNLMLSRESKAAVYALMSLMSDEAAAKIVETDVENVAIIEPGKTIKEFRATNAGPFELDIAHGGYPATFKEFADTRAREK